MDVRTVNKPISEEKAGVFHSWEEEPPGYSHMACALMSKRSKVNFCLKSPHSDHMLYDDLFYGESGWDSNDP